MTDVDDLLTCPNCGMQEMELIIRKKQAEALCFACNEIVTSRVPYPKHRVDDKGHQYHFEVPSVRPIWTHDEDDLTCSQEEYEERNS